jgi:hypothetical protein
MSTAKNSSVDVRSDRVVYKDVKSAALEDAIAKAKPSPWTKSMFLVSLIHRDVKLVVNIL